MQKARRHAQEHGAHFTPALSPAEGTVEGASPKVNVAAMHAAGFRVVPWTVNDPEKMRELIRLRVDGIISDRPDLLQKVIREERATAGNSQEVQNYFSSLDAEGHRGGRGLRPENTLPAFEGGLDNLITSIETDTGVTNDHVSLIWHDQFLNPDSCRRADGSEYTMTNRVYTQDISMADAQKQFICDKGAFWDIAEEWSVVVAGRSSICSQRTHA
jgi:glycerophosphoryl diester phosphodiesterase